MKKRILSIMLAVCMAAAMAPAMSNTASAQGSCTCLVKCTDSYEDPDCPACNSGGSCGGRYELAINNGTGITDAEQLQNAANLDYHAYYFSLGADITYTKGSPIITVPEGADFALNLNGHTISGFTFKVSGKMALIDTVGTGKVKNCDYGAFNITGGYALMDGGTIE